MNIVKEPKFEFTQEDLDAIDRVTDIVKGIKDELASMDVLVSLKGNGYEEVETATNVLVDIYNGIDRRNYTLEFDYET